MRINKNGEDGVTIKLNGNNLEQVNSLKYLGSTLTSNGYCSTEIRCACTKPSQCLYQPKEFYAWDSFWIQY